MASWWTTITEQIGNFNYRALWQPEELLSIRPPLEWELRWGYISFVVLCWFFALALPFLNKLHPALRERLSPLLWTNALLGVILYFLRNERIPYLGMDLLRAIQVWGSLIWLSTILWYSQKGLRVILIQEEVARKRAQYLPKPKKS